jgi:prephenate dehydrogenase
MAAFQKITIIGMGLIGGSAGMAALKKGISDEVVGVVRRPETVGAALSLGAASRCTLSLEEGVSGADFVLAASPPASVPGIIGKCLPLLRPGAVITDAASVKRDIVREIAGFIGGGVRFAGSHPVAGSEKSGVEAADSNLFEGASCIVTPAPDDCGGREEVKKFWEMLGMRVTVMSPEAHDSLMALTSHLPHIASCGLMNAVSAVFAREPERPFIFAGGFRDSTRIASAPPGLWNDIIISNRDNIAEALGEYADMLKALQDALARGDSDYVLGFLKDAAAGRERLLNPKNEAEK